MDIEIRALTEDDWPAFVRAETSAFGMQPLDADLAGGSRAWDLERGLAAFDQGQLVGTTGAFSFDLTLPGLTAVPASGVTWVGVMPTHRRRGILTGLMSRQLDDVRRRGEPLAVLRASEATIYGRFGYGAAVDSATYTIERRHAAPARPAPAAGRLVLVDAESAAEALPGVHEAARRGQPGDVSRPPGWWARWFSRDEAVDGSSARFHVLHQGGDGGVDGYTSYRIRRRPEDNMPGRATVVVDALTATSFDAYTALWQFVCDIDLTASVEADNRPVDEPLRWMLADPRRLEGRVADFLWVRLVDAAAALAARRYAAEGSLVIGLTDAFCPWNDGAWSLEGGPDGAACRRTDALPDLVLGAAELGTAYLGGTRLSTLGRAGRVEEMTPGALARADAMLACEPLPWCRTSF